MDFSFPRLDMSLQAYEHFLRRQEEKYLHEILNLLHSGVFTHFTWTLLSFSLPGWTSTPAGPSSDRASWQDGIRGRLLLNPTPSCRCPMTSYTFHSLHWTAITYISDDPWLNDWFRSMWVSSEVCDETYIWRSPLYLTPLALWLVSNN